MSDSNPPPIPKIEPPRPLETRPGFLLAWRGIWLFTWQSQFTWRRFPMRLITLLALPFLIYITSTTPDDWARRHPLMGNSYLEAKEFAHRLERAKLPLNNDQRTQLQRIFREEFARTEAEANALDAQSADTSQRDQTIRRCYENIRLRAQPLLSAEQMLAFQNFEKRSVQLVENRAAEPQWTWTAPFYHWLIDFYFFLILPVTCVQLSGGLIRSELQTDTLGFLTTRPLSRARLVVLKYLSQAIWLQLLLLAETLLLFAVGGLRHIPALGLLFPLFLAAQFLAVFAWSALGLFLGQISTRYIALALVYGAVVELGIGRIPTNINTLSIMRHLKTLLAHNSALQELYEWSGTGVPLSLGALVFAAAIFLALSALLFTFREYHHTAEMQK